MQRRRNFDEVCEMLSNLLRNGFPMTDALDYLRQMYGAGKAIVVDDAIACVQNGDRVTTAWQPYLTPLCQCALEAGEQAGELGRALALWHGYTARRKHEAEAALRTLTYPGLLCLILFALVIVVSVAVVPAFASMYATLGLAVPPGTRIVFAIFQDVWTWALGFFALTGAGCVVVWQMRRAAPAYWYRIKVRIPLIKLLWAMRTEQFGRLLTLLTDSGISLVDAMKVLSAQAGPLWLRDRAQEIQVGLLNGSRLSDLLQPDWDPLLAVCIRLAEASGDLRDSLLQLCQQLDSEVQRKINRLVRRTEPALLLLLGSVVSLLMFGVFAPMYQLAAQLASAPITGGA